MKMLITLLLLSHAVAVDARSANENIIVNTLIDAAKALVLFGHDDVLDSHLSLILNEQHKQPKLKSNAYVLMYAFDLKTDDIYQKGLEIFSLLEQNLKATNQGPDTRWVKVLDQFEKHPPESTELHCYRRKPNCFQLILNNAEERSRLLEKNGIYIKRYQEFLNQNQFVSVQMRDWGVEDPELWSLYLAQNLFHLELLKQLEKNADMDILNPIIQEIESLRHFMVTVDSWDMKLVIKDLLEECYEFLNHLRVHELYYINVNDLNLSAFQALNNDELSTYLPEMQSISFAFRNAYAMASISDQPEFLSPEERNAVNLFLWRHFFKANLTMNTAYHRTFKPILNHAQLGSKDFFNNEIIVDYRFRNDLVRNPFYEKFFDQLLKFAVKPDDQFQYRIHNLNLKLRLFRALVNEGSADKVIEAANQGNQQYLNPYNDSLPFIKANKLCFSGKYEKHINGRCLAF